MNIISSDDTVRRLSDLQGFSFIERQAVEHCRYYDSSVGRWRPKACWLERLIRYLFCIKYSDVTIANCMRRSMEALLQTYQVAAKFGPALKGRDVKYFDWLESQEYMTRFHQAEVKDPISADIMRSIKECIKISSSLEIRINRTVFVIETDCTNKSLIGPREYAGYRLHIYKTAIHGISMLGEGCCVLMFRGQEVPIGFRKLPQGEGVDGSMPYVGHLKQYLAYTYKVPYHSLKLVHDGNELADASFLPIRIEIRME